GVVAVCLVATTPLMTCGAKIALPEIEGEVALAAGTTTPLAGVAPTPTAPVMTRGEPAAVATVDPPIAAALLTTTPPPPPPPPEFLHFRMTILASRSDSLRRTPESSSSVDRFPDSDL